MIDLLLAEADRLRSRRVFLVGLIVLLVALAGFQVIVGFTVRQPTASDIATARAQYQQAQRDYQQCTTDNPDRIDEYCGSSGPSWQDFQPRAAGFAEMAGVAVTISVVFSSLAFLIISASSIGAEYGSGAIANWLTFVPNRLRVYASKLGVLVITAAVVAAAAAALSLVSTTLLVMINSGPVDHLGDLIATGARGLIVVVVAATLGFGLALISRHTIASLGAVLGYLVVDFVLFILMNTLEALQRVKPWLPENNALAVLNNGHDYQDSVRRVTSDGVQWDYLNRHISFGHGLAYLTVVLVIAVVVPMLVFGRRDIT